MNSKEVTEHGASMYRQRGCRCETCRFGMSSARKKYRPISLAGLIRLDAAPLVNFLINAEQLQNVSSKTVARWQREGLSVYTADKWCLYFGVHPVEIYGHKFHEGCFDSEMANG